LLRSGGGSLRWATTRRRLSGVGDGKEKTVMQQDAAPERDVALAPDVSEADGIEQSLPLRTDADDTDGARRVYDDPIPGDANPDDVLEQRFEVPLDDDEYPAG